jgi:hypothetical protein
MKRMMERLTITDRNPPRENQATPQIGHPNFRRNPPHIRQRDPRDQWEQWGPDQQIRPPLQENYVYDGEEVIEDFDDAHINLMGDHDHDHESIFLTQEEHEIFLLSQIEVNEEAKKIEHQAFENAIMEVQKKYNLRSKKTNKNSPKKAAETKKTLENPPKNSLGVMTLNLLHKNLQKFLREQVGHKFHQPLKQEHLSTKFLSIN